MSGIINPSGGGGAFTVSTNLQAARMPSGTWYLNPITGTRFSGVDDAQIYCEQAATISRLRFLTGDAQPGTGSLVVTLMVAGAATSVTATVAAGAGANTFTDLVNTAAITAGQAWCYRFVNNAATDSAFIRPVGVLITPS